MKKYLIIILFLILSLPLTAQAFPPVKQGAAGVSDEAYDQGAWDNVTGTAPSKNAVRDKIETLGGGHDPVTFDAEADAILSLVAQQIGLDNQNANKCFCGPASGGDAKPTIRSLVPADIPDISSTYQPLNANLTNLGTLSYTAPAFVKMTGVNTFGLDTNTYQQADSEITALAGLTSAANKIPYFTGPGAAGLLDFKDEDNMASDSDTALASQQSIKAYADTKVIISGAPIANDIAVWTSASALKGVSLTVDKLVYWTATGPQSVTNFDLAMNNADDNSILMVTPGTKVIGPTTRANILIGAESDRGDTASVTTFDPCASGSNCYPGSSIYTGDTYPTTHVGWYIKQKNLCTVGIYITGTAAANTTDPVLKMPKTTTNGTNYFIRMNYGQATDGTTPGEGKILAGTNDDTFQFTAPGRISDTESGTPYTAYLDFPTDSWTSGATRTIIANFTYLCD